MARLGFLMLFFPSCQLNFTGLVMSQRSSLQWPGMTLILLFHSHQTPMILPRMPLTSRTTFMIPSTSSPKNISANPLVKLSLSPEGVCVDPSALSENSTLKPGDSNKFPIPHMLNKEANSATFTVDTGGKMLWLDIYLSSWRAESLSVHSTNDSQGISFFLVPARHLFALQSYRHLFNPPPLLSTPNPFLIHNVSISQSTKLMATMPPENQSDSVPGAWSTKLLTNCVRERSKLGPSLPCCKEGSHCCMSITIMNVKGMVHAPSVTDHLLHHTMKDNHNILQGIATPDLHFIHGA
ncbi:hypothetical protein F5141DRAFT_1068523 [Pisolithus sp. B1]|nr:hypothetical protein F5141DRAFT_1068523 [Pisolithus sp. B1]